MNIFSFSFNYFLHFFWISLDLDLDLIQEKLPSKDLLGQRLIRVKWSPNFICTSFSIIYFSFIVICTLSLVRLFISHHTYLIYNTVDLIHHYIHMVYYCTHLIKHYKHSVAMLYAVHLSQCGDPSIVLIPGTTWYSKHYQVEPSDTD